MHLTYRFIHIFIQIHTDRTDNLIAKFKASHGINVNRKKPSYEPCHAIPCYILNTKIETALFRAPQIFKQPILADDYTSFPYAVVFFQRTKIILFTVNNLIDVLRTKAENYPSGLRVVYKFTVPCKFNTQDVITWTYK